MQRRLVVRPSHASCEDALRKIYDLREDTETVAQIQHATLTTKEFGLVPEHGLFGSTEWWRAVEGGILPVVQVDGYISRVFLSGHHDYEEFEVDANGERTSWTCVTSGGPGGSPERIAKGEMYQVGRPVLIRYVKQRFRQTIRGIPFSKSVLEIWVGQLDE